MKTYEERTQDVLSKIKTVRRRRSITGAVITAVCLGVLALVLFFPYQAPSVRQYRSSPYYDVIKKLNAICYKPQYQNLYDQLSSQPLLWLESGKGDMFDSNAAAGDAVDEMVGGGYQEVTDNQVAGVIEADIFKRTDRHIFYLRKEGVYAYSIAGRESQEVGCCPLALSEADRAVLYREMYLSEDGSCLTVLLSGYVDGLSEGQTTLATCLISINVADPANMRETERLYLTGEYQSSRLVDGNLLVMTRYSFGRNVDFGKPETYLPRYGLPGQMQCIGAEEIALAEPLESTCYTVVTMLKEKSLEVTASAALLSYAGEIYVSKENIFVTGGFFQSGQEENITTSSTQIAGICYADGKLCHLGSTNVAGSVRNQYSLDEYNGILRVVTTLEKNTRIYDSWGYVRNRLETLSASLYCISLEDWSVSASVEAFAPEGEGAMSVRFDGDMAYVCTAEIITLTDPVYFFDLSDLTNITWKDTGTIDGYSSSLVNFGDCLLGIGYGENRLLKIEVYRQTETGVESVAVYERECNFSTDYKSYFIDRENQRIGLGIYDYESEEPGRYLLLQFDGEQLYPLVNTPLVGDNQIKRGVGIEDWLYLMGSEGEFQVIGIDNGVK